MHFTSVPIIVLCCYIFAEIYKYLFRKNKDIYKIIPILTAFIGGIMGLLIFLTAPEMILDADNIWIAIGIGILSGTSSTGTNQIIKKVFSIYNNRKIDFCEVEDDK